MNPSPSSPVILGVPIAAITLPEALARIGALIKSGGSHQVVTVNPEFLVAARYRPDFAATLRGAALATADGAGVVLAGRLLGAPFRGRVTGTDLAVALAQRCAAQGWGMFLLGAAPGVAEQAAQALRRTAPDLRIVGIWSGSPRVADEPEILARVQAAQPDILLVAYGAPAQDLWLSRNLARTPARVGIGVGGAFDYLAGVKPRAPALMQRAGLEWVYRLYREPWRARRMLALPAFGALIAREFLARRLLQANRTGEGN